MKKKLLLAATIAVSSFAFGQVGINTATPKATLDVTSAPTDLTKTDGFIAPRLTGAELKAKDANYDVPQTGTIIYVTQALLPVDTTTKTTNVTAIGYYYFDGTMWQILNTTSNGIWNKKGTTNTIAKTTTDNIWRSGSAAIGEDIGNSAVKFAITNRITDGITGNSSGLGSMEYSNGPGQKSAIYGFLEDTATSGTSINLGVLSTVDDKSTTISGGSSGSFAYHLIGSKSNPSTTITGTSSNAFLYSTGTLTAGNVFGSLSYTGGDTASSVSNTGDISVNNLRAYDGSARPYTVGGHTFTSPMVIGGQMEVSLQGSSSSNLTSAYGVNASINTAMAGGSLNISNAFAALRSYTGFGSTGTYTVNKLYGVFVDAAESGSGSRTINNSYGLFISRYRFTGDKASNAYNLYSQGADTKNYFQGRIGAGTNVPAAQLHVVKQASDLTPAIIEGCPDLADNAAALAAGLPVGALYKTGDVLKVVH
ncbi:hypothetical protein [Chryseobacterium culicis]|uniref:hypothetical protein n=1 Tax=Chryseobacterium culicis TaxID=680127 RepID=UPI00187608B1|nr:hypothetical protein [Chryseobacterium culicis]MBE4947202.1 hypothetical protein [Chryseobacterium culicis]